jgi:hypothetical protein
MPPHIIPFLRFRIAGVAEYVKPERGTAENKAEAIAVVFVN